ncbi:uncharacterized protein LOC110645028 isoform X3 [Hevea brasiliensis]|uniref:uncharacterized protein LOC110645028 isoform X3 n=1 Tax=Hevea brasiliensis TaxID=3981 RepID=UPI0025EB394D|nr:uncharacterized protein LOC110645028 isoform X3 [Hevea brasiliensis]
MCSIQSSFLPLIDLFSLSTNSLPKLKNDPAFLRLPLPKAYNHHSSLRAVLSIEEVPPNALRRKSDPQWRGGFSLGVDLGLSRTGLAISKGFSVRPLMVLELRGQKLELRLLEIAENEEVDEFIIGIPKSWDGKETPQSNKVRSVAGRLAVRAAERGWRVYLQDEHGTSTEATYRMINICIEANKADIDRICTSEGIIMSKTLSAASARVLGKRALMSMQLWYAMKLYFLL